MEIWNDLIISWFLFNLEEHIVQEKISLGSLYKYLIKIYDRSITLSFWAHTFIIWICLLCVHLESQMLELLLACLWAQKVIMNFNNNTIVISRDVHFYETQFPYKILSHTHQSDQIPSQFLASFLHLLFLEHRL